MTDHAGHLREAVALAVANAEEGGAPYGALVVHAGRVVARCANTIHRTGDPTDHAEMVGLRKAARAIGRAALAECIVYASGRPCPMCHAAMRLSGIREAYFAFTAEEADRHGLDTAGLYAEMCLPLESQPMQVRYLPTASGPNPYARWAQQQGA